MTGPQISAGITLKRRIGLAGAVLMGLGSIIGTGVFVSIGVAAGAAGSGVLLAIVAAAFVATFNGLNSAQLAANHPVSGGTYEYGYRFLNPQFGFIAGWTFLLAKSASAATAALGASSYILTALHWSEALLIPFSLLIVASITLIAYGDIQRSNRFNAAVLMITLFALSAFIVLGAGTVNIAFFSDLFPKDGNLGGFLEATALMFVAYTGYGRIATLGEEVHDPRRTIPQAVVAALAIVAILYFGVALIAIETLSAPVLASVAQSGAAPLQVAADQIAVPGLSLLVGLGAITAMLSVLINLVLGLSRVWLAMGRRGDMPPRLAQVNAQRSTPQAAVLLTGIVIGCIVLVGSIRVAWSFSAFSVLIYYAITNLAALKIPTDARLAPRWVAWAGLIACLFLAFWVDPAVWIVGLILIAVGLIWQMIAWRIFRTSAINLQQISKSDEDA